MNTPTTQNLSSAIDAFFGVPTRDNHHRLLEADEEYRDLWISGPIALHFALPFHYNSGLSPIYT